MHKQNNPIIFISGPTAVGKSDIALQIADQCNGEIIACDSMQVYREINIASNKPSLQERSKIPHHLIDVASVYDEFDVNQYARLANGAIKEILKRGMLPIVCGGTGLYMEALIDGVFEGPQADWDLRARLMDKKNQGGNLDIYDRLKEVDPNAALKIHKNDTRRIVRALEVYELTGKPISVWQKERKGLADEYAIKSFVLTRPRDDLYAAINQRVDIMINEGLIEEVKVLDTSRISRTAAQLIGVKEALASLGGEFSREEAIDNIKQNSRNYAKRQLTWYRKDKRNVWIDIDENDPIKEILKTI